MNAFSKFLIPLSISTMLMFSTANADPDSNPASSLADQLEQNTNVIGVIGGSNKSVAIVFKTTPEADEAKDVCTKASGLGFTTIHKIISGKLGHPLEDICP